MTATLHLDDSVFVILTETGKKVLDNSGFKVEPDSHGVYRFHFSNLVYIFGHMMTEGAAAIFKGSHVHLIHPKG